MAANQIKTTIIALLHFMFVLPSHFPESLEIKPCPLKQQKIETTLPLLRMSERR